MTDKEFVDWLRGFADGVHHYNITPAQWDMLKEKLAKVGTSKNYVITEGWTTTVA